MDYTTHTYGQMKDFAKEYAEKGAYHSDAHGFSRWWLKDNYRLLAMGAQRGETILDLACGDGALSRYLPPATLIGIDNVQQSLDLNRSSYPGVYERLVLGDMRDIAACHLGKSSLDRIICSLSLMYLIPDDLRSCLRTLRDVLKDGGEMVFSYPSIHVRRSANPTAAELSLADIARIFAGAGFVIEHVVPVCPLQPSWVVAWSIKPYLSWIAWIRYKVSRVFIRAFKDSYHFVAFARKI